MIIEQGHIGIIMGGPSAEYDISLQSGQMLLDALLSRHPNVKPIVVSNEGHWQVDGHTAPVIKALQDVKLAILATHGQWGEDGHLQAILEHFRIPYTGSGVTASAAAFDKSVSQAIFSACGLETPEVLLLEKNSLFSETRTNEIISYFPKGPWVVKPTQAGSSMGVSVVKKTNELARAAEYAWQFGPKILIEEYIAGTEVTCGILEDLGTGAYALPLTQIIPPPQHDFFDFSAKYSGETKEITPAPLDPQLTFLIQQAGIRAHKAIGARHYSRVDIIVKDGIPYVLELNTLPGLTAESLLPKQAAAAGLSFIDLLERLMQLALKE